MVEVLASLAAIGCGLVLLMWRMQRRLLDDPAPETGDALPGISILKPLHGVDPGLEHNLESFLELDYPDYELILGIQDPADPAVDIARRFVARSGSVPVQVVVGDARIGFNPKVNNLAGMLARARHDVLWISDANVAVRRETLRSMVGHLLEPGIGLVTSLIRGVGGHGPGGVLEAVQLNTFVMGGVATATTVFGRVAAVGKSMLLRRSDLERIGGFAVLGRYLAEDQVCAELLDEAGREVVVSGPPVDNVLGALSVRQFVDRHLRWARIRRHMAPWGYAAELLTNPVPAALLLVAVDPGIGSAAVFATVMTVLSGVARSSERRLGVRRSLWRYPIIEIARGLLVTILWPVPFLSRTVTWRGSTFRIGRRTWLEPYVDGWDGGDEPAAHEVTV